MASPVLLGVRILLECVDQWLLAFAEFFYKKILPFFVFGKSNSFILCGAKKDGQLG